MNAKHKDQAAILKKLGISRLNEMQREAFKSIRDNPEVILLSPTGTGKTLAFLLPILNQLKVGKIGVQALVLVPSRELAIQIEQVVREMGSGHKVLAVYGGRAGSKDRLELKHPPTILIGTPGRVADHIRRGAIDTQQIKTLVLDEFDKSLEVGFEGEMGEIVQSLKSLHKKVLTSATEKAVLPAFIDLSNPMELNFLGTRRQQLSLKTVVSPTPNLMPTLGQLLQQIGNGNGILFCNFKDTIQEVSDFLNREEIQHACFYGGLEQTVRERALIKFRNGTHRLLVATDLAARGIDVPELDFIIHYQIPDRLEEFTHRNGRTARMHKEGTAYILKPKNKDLPGFIEDATEFAPIPDTEPVQPSRWKTLFISGGRKDKISKGDIAGLFFKQGGLKKEELGIIELKQDCAFVAVPGSRVRSLINGLNNIRLKKKKVRISLLE